MIKADEIIKSKRNTLSISIDKNGRVIVRAPYDYSNEEIERFILKSQRWLKKSLDEYEKVRDNVSAYSICDGGVAPVFGKAFPIRFTDKKNAFIENGILFLPEENAQAGFEKLLKKLASDYFRECLDAFCGVSGLKHGNVRITKAKTRWGSCNSDSNICLSVYLAMCPKDVIDYVIVHEMCHLKYMSHSSLFWREVEKYIPDYKAKRKWLSDNRAIVNLFQSPVKKPHAEV